MNKKSASFTTSIEHLQRVLLECYTKDLCYPKISEKWTEDNKCFGMCAITTLIVNDYMGGKIGKTYVDGISHYFNIINDEIVDLTAKQFSHPIDYFDYQLVQREDMMVSASTHKRYKTLKERLLAQDMKHEKSCGTIVINQNKVLLIGAKDNDGEMFWSFPKGHQEEGETDTETALRETSEEVGLEVEIVNQTPIIVSHLIHGDTAIKDIYLFLAKTTDKKVQPQAGEVENYKWANFDEADEYLTDYYKEAWREARKRKT